MTPAAPGEARPNPQTYNRAGVQRLPSSFKQQVPTLQQSRLSGSQSLGPGHRMCFSVTWDREFPAAPPCPQEIPFPRIAPQSHKHRNLYALATCPDTGRPHFSFSRPSQCKFIRAFNLLFLLEIDLDEDEEESRGE